MNLPRYISIVAVIFVTSFSLSSCGDDFLNQPPRSSLTEGNFPVNAADAELAVNGAYNSLRSWQINSGGFPIFDMMSDQATKGSSPGDGTAISVYDKFEHTPSEGSLERYYKTAYEAIRRTNLCIEEFPNIDMDPTRRDELLAEARFLRAYFYGLMVRSFGAIPKVTEVNPPLDLERSDPMEIMNDIIIPDLEFAISLLPEKSQQDPALRTRATKGAARGILARLYMFYGDYTNAEIYLEDLVNSQEYELEPDYNDVFPDANEHGIESIFEISALPLSFAEGGHQYANTQAIRGSPNRGWGFSRPAYTWIDKMQNANDNRLDPSVIFLGEELAGVLTNGDSSTPDTTYENGVIVEIECYNQKVWHSGTTTLESFGHNKRVLRYADILLLYAEALTRNGNPSDAPQYINRVRQRAADSGSGTMEEVTTVDPEELLSVIMEERDRELAFEGQRFWDLVRTNKAEEILGPLGFVVNKHELLPIPQSEVDVSQGKITQNPGY